MARSTTRDSTADKANAAAGKVSGDGARGGTFRPLTFTGGSSEVYNPRKKGVKSKG